MSTFPKLKEAGGYELLRTHEHSKSLRVTPEGYTGYYLKSVLGQAKCFIHPIQNDLAIDYSPATEVIECHFINNYLIVLLQIPDSVPHVECKKCKQMIPMIILHDHSSNCLCGYAIHAVAWP